MGRARIEPTNRGVLTMQTLENFALWNHSEAPNNYLWLVRCGN